MQDGGGGGGGTTHQDGGGGVATPNQERHPFVRSLMQEMGCSPQDLQRPHTARQRGADGAGEEGRKSSGVREGVPPPLGGRGAPEDQAHLLFDNIVNAPPGRIPPSSQAPAHHIWKTCPTRGGRRWGAGVGVSGEEGEEGEGARGYKAAGPTPGREDFRQEATEHGEEMGPADEEEER